MSKKNLSDRQLAFAGQEIVTTVQINTNLDMIYVARTGKDTYRIHDCEGKAHSNFISFHNVLDGLKEMFDEKGNRR